MAMPAPHRRWTRSEVKALIDVNPGPTPRYELVDGELLVTPSPIGPHQRAVRGLILALDPYLVSTGVGEVLTAPFDVELEPETIVQPDVFVVPLIVSCWKRRISTSAATIDPAYGGAR